MPVSNNLSAAFNMPPEKAIEYFKSKGYQVTFDWHDMWHDAHAQAFTVAGVTSLDVLVDIRKAIETAQNTGKSLESFKQDLKPLLKKKGWLGEKTIKKPDGSTKEIDLSQPWRLKTIYQTNMQTAYMAGRYKGMIDAIETRPYWRYVAVMDGRTRDEHRKLHGKVLRYDDPFWDNYFPPNGWGCRCRAVSISKYEAEKKGLRITDGEEISPEAALTVAPEWQYNPGKSFWQPNTKKYTGWEREKVEQIVAKVNRIRDEKDGNYILPELPKINKAVIPTSKLTSYALDEIKQSDKARAFREALGYTKANAQELLDNIKRNLPHFPAQKRGNNGYGERYEVIMTLKGPNDKTVKVLTGWIDDIETGEMRLTTIHIDL